MTLEQKSIKIETGNWIKKQLELTEEIQQIETELKKLIAIRKTIPYRIPIAQMPEEIRYRKLNQESKHLQNIIKMICYRAETAFANHLSKYYARSDDEIRSLVKAIINQSIDLCPDYDKKELNITLYPLANQRSNRAIANLIDTINDSKTLYPNHCCPIKKTEGIEVSFNFFLYFCT